METFIFGSSRLKSFVKVPPEDDEFGAHLSYHRFFLSKMMSINRFIQFDVVWSSFLFNFSFCLRLASSFKTAFQLTGKV